MNTAREFQVFVKPVGGDCNIRCGYCYYIDKQRLSKGIMADEVLEKYIEELTAATTDDHILFAWHGGEPTLAGLSYFRKVVEVQKRVIGSRKKIINGIQTNATLLDDKWCAFFSENNFLVGVSIDGPGIFHNKLRLTGNGKGSFDRVMKGYLLLKKHGVVTEILTVVSSVNSGQPEEIYQFLREIGGEYITFLPLVIKTNGNKTGVTASSVIPDDFGSFLISVFNKWVSEDIGRVKIQIIEEALRTSFRQDHTLCIFKRICGGVPVVERNGDFYCCDHFVDRDHLVGNILKKPLAEMIDSEMQLSFGQIKKNTLPQYCLDCEVLDMCNGECPKNRFIKAPDGEAGLNYLCTGYKSFFNHIKPFADTVAEAWGRG
jgi:uncharacterized protein